MPPTTHPHYLLCPCMHILRIICSGHHISQTLHLHCQNVSREKIVAVPLSGIVGALDQGRGKMLCAWVHRLSVSAARH